MIQNNKTVERYTMLRELMDKSMERIFGKGEE